ncbi:hypothetical protein D3C80_1591720 [compost metagenome]
MILRVYRFSLAAGDKEDQRIAHLLLDAVVRIGDLDRRKRRRRADTVGIKRPDLAAGERSQHKNTSQHRQRPDAGASSIRQRH